MFQIPFSVCIQKVEKFEHVSVDPVESFFPEKVCEHSNMGFQIEGMGQ